MASKVKVVFTMTHVPKFGASSQLPRVFVIRLAFKISLVLYAPASNPAADVVKAVPLFEVVWLSK